MKISPARRICIIVWSLVTCFVLINYIPSPQVGGSTTVSTTTTTAHTTPHVVKPVVHWYTPIFVLGPEARAFFTCVEFRESRSTWSHPHTHDSSDGQYGIFQITWPSQNNAWDAYVFPTLHVEPPYASAFQQAEGAAILWKIGDEIQTWSLWDGCQP